MEGGKGIEGAGVKKASPANRVSWTPKYLVCPRDISSSLSLLPPLPRRAVPPGHPLRAPCNCLPCPPTPRGALAHSIPSVTILLDHNGLLLSKQPRPELPPVANRAWILPARRTHHTAPLPIGDALVIQEAMLSYTRGEEGDGEGGGGGQQHGEEERGEEESAGERHRGEAMIGARIFLPGSKPGFRRQKQNVINRTSFESVAQAVGIII